MLSTEINETKGHSVQLFEWHRFPRQRQILSPQSKLIYCTECQKLELPQFQLKTDLKIMGTREMARWLGTQTALALNPNSVPSTHSR